VNETPAPGSSALSERSKAAHRRVTLIVGSMISSLFVYVLVVELVGRGSDVVTMASVPEIVRWVFYAAAVSMVFATNLIMTLMMRGFQPRNDDEFIARMTVAHVVTAALSETPAILGLVLFGLARERADFYILSVISLYLLLRHFPRLSRWESLAARYAPGR
jgi:hypothetical protein